MNICHDIAENRKLRFSYKGQKRWREAAEGEGQDTKKFKIYHVHMLSPRGECNNYTLQTYTNKIKIKKVASGAGYLILCKLGLICGKNNYFLRGML